MVAEDLHLTLCPGSLVPYPCVPGFVERHLQVVRLVGLDALGLGQDVFVGLQDQLGLLQVVDGGGHVCDCLLDAARQVVEGTVDVARLFFHDYDVFVQTLLFYFQFIDADFLVSNEITAAVYFLSQVLAVEFESTHQFFSLGMDSYYFFLAEFEVNSGVVKLYFEFVLLLLH